MFSTIELYFLIQEIKEQEPELCTIIEKMMSIYTFESNKGLREAVKLWYSNREQWIRWYGHISFWDVSKITDMSHLFRDLDYFNEDVSRWNVSNVVNMSWMFCNAKTFNQPLNNWNVSNVNNMCNMFLNASKFNQPLNDWNISNTSIKE